jgi:GR25 family glycosyltransferase involved in LPS biosynthesis
MLTNGGNTYIVTFNMAHVKIISITNPIPDSIFADRISHKHSKHIHRKKYVNEILYPSLRKSFKNVDIFSAITPDDFNFIDGVIYYKNIKLNYYGPFPSNLISNYVLWKMCIELNEPMLILEDDSFFPSENINNIVKSIDDFEKLPDDGQLLYLLSQCPQNTAMKKYSKSKLENYDENFFVWKCNPEYLNPIQPDDLYEDISGTAAYVIRPMTAKILCEMAEIGTEATDRFVGRSSVENKIDIIIPKNYGNLFLLHEQLNEWNILHKNLVPPKWNELPPSLQFAYLMNNTIKLENRYVDEINNVKETFTFKQVEEFISGAKQRKCKDYGVYGPTDEWLYEALDIIPIQNKTVAIMGSIRPWYESVALSFGGLPTTVEYNLPGFNHPLIKEILLPELVLSGERFDIAISVSSFEHDGLGRYGDPLNPNGDFRAMDEMKKILKPDGLLFLAVPCGLDKMVWNAHRVYGNKRLPLLLENWEVVGTVGYNPDYLSVDMGDSGVYQPIIVLKNI